MADRTYHVNNEYKAGPCRAEKGRCPFGGYSGTENHFDTKAEAVADAERQIVDAIEEDSAPQRARYVAAISDKLTEAAQADQGQYTFPRFATELPEPGAPQSYTPAPTVQFSDQAKLWVEASVRNFHERNYPTFHELGRGGIGSGELSEIFADEIVNGTAVDERIAAMKNHGLSQKARTLKRLKKAFQAHPLSSIADKMVIDRSSGEINIR